MPELDGRVAIVTGGASGLGAATAQALAESGAKVAVADLDGDRADEVAASLPGTDAIAVRVDVSDEDQVAAAIKRVVGRFGRLDILHNNAALTAPDIMRRDAAIHELELDVWEPVHAVNLRGVFLGSKHAIPHMLERGAGVIINTASDAGLTAASHPAYGASKAGVIGFTRNIATQYGKRGIRCVGIAPGLVITPAAENNVSDEMKESMLRHHLTPRLGRPEDIAHTVVFLASDRAGFITGITIPVDGGFIAHAPTYADEMAMAGQA